MKKLLCLFGLMLVGCDQPCYCQKILNIQPQHATRAYVTMKCLDGNEDVHSLNWSNYVTCGNQTYYVGDYIPGYGTKKFEATK